MARKDDGWYPGMLAAQDQYNPEEGAFQAGVRDTPWHREFEIREGGPPNLNDPDYDYRAAWAAGARPDVRDPGDGAYHWPSQYKGENHPNRYVDGMDTRTGQPVMGEVADIAATRLRAPYAKAYQAAQERPTIINTLRKYPEDLARRAIQNSQFAVDTGTYDPQPTLEAAGFAMTGATPLASRVSKAGEFTLGVVPVDAAKAFGIKPSVSNTPLLEQAVKNTPGAAFDDGFLRMKVARQQHPDQEMTDSVRGGVFYLPEGADRYLSIYKKGGTTPGHHYGGTQAVSGETAFANPLVVKGATGGKAPEAAYNQLMGDKKAIKALDADTMEVVSASWMNRGNYGVKQLDMVERFLEKHAPEMTDKASWILENSKKGNQLRYALQEAAIASAARKAGHDGIVGYTATRTRPPKLSEVFDVRERSYPSPSGDFDVWPRDTFGSLAAQDKYKP